MGLLAPVKSFFPKKMLNNSLWPAKKYAEFAACVA